MAGGRKRDFKAEYARRIANATAKGKTRQQARGHVAREHVRRKEREIEREGITSQQRAVIRRFVERWNDGNYWEEGRAPWAGKGWRLEEEYVEAFVLQEGYEFFVKYKDIWTSERRRYLKDGETGEGLSRLVLLRDKAGVPDERWMYYH